MNRKLEGIIDDAEQWELYTERHPDAWQGKEWAIEIVRRLLAWDREEL